MILTSKEIKDTLERTEIMFEGSAKYKPRQDRILKKQIIRNIELRLGLKKEEL